MPEKPAFQPGPSQPDPDDPACGNNSGVKFGLTTSESVKETA